MEVAILGAGVAGASAAIALKQRGHDVRVYERRAAPATMGGGIVAWPNATFVLEQLGVLPEIEAVSGRPRSMRRVSSTGGPLGAIDIGLIDAQLGRPSLSVLRHDLQRVLLARLGSLGVEVCYGRNASSIESMGGGRAEVGFESGERLSADLILGADGRMASVARRYVHGIGAPVYQGFVNWVGVFESNEEVFPETAILDFWGIGQRFGVVPIAANRAYWAGGAACDEAGPRAPADYREELLAQFTDWPPPVRTLIEQSPADQITKVYVHDHDPIAVWHKHNVLLIGDAAHAPLPTSGQGACQALEDAWQLAGCLTANPGDWRQAFNEFTSLRREKTAAITMAARRFASSLFNQDAAYCRARNEASKATDFTAAAAGMAELWGRDLLLAGSP